jgi:hypothetical protein
MAVGYRADAFDPSNALNPALADSVGQHECLPVGCDLVPRRFPSIVGRSHDRA